MVRNPSRFAVRATRTAISPRLAIRTEENMDMRYHPGNEEYTLPDVFHRPLPLAPGVGCKSLSLSRLCVCAHHRPRLLAEMQDSRLDRPYRGCVVADV